MDDIQEYANATTDVPFSSFRPPRHANYTVSRMASSQTISFCFSRLWEIQLLLDEPGPPVRMRLAYGPIPTGSQGANRSEQPIKG